MRNTTLTPGAALLLGMVAALFLGALLSDVAYSQTYEVQWANFASWLIAGGLLLGGILVAVATVNFFRRSDGTRPGLMLALVGLMWIIGLFNAFVHSHDGWAMMPTGLILSVIVALIAFAAAVVGLRHSQRVEAQ